jgi:ketosteroid isomerase-like protein
VIIEMLVVLAGVAMTPENIRQEVICAETGFSRSAERRDREAFLSYLHPDARFVGGRVSRGREAVLEAWSPILAEGGPAIRWRPMIIEITEDGTLALSRGPFRTVQIDEDGASVETWGHFNSVWQRGEDGRWRVLFDVGGDVGMTPTAEEIAAFEGEPDCP